MKKLLGIVVLCLLWCSIANAFLLNDSLKFETGDSSIVRGKINFDGKEFKVWTRKDFKGPKNIQRNIVQFVAVDDITKKKVQISIIYYPTDNRHSYRFYDYVKSSEKKKNYYLIEDRTNKKYWYSKAIIYRYLNLEKKNLHYGKWFLSDDQRWMYGVVDTNLPEDKRWLVFEGSNNKLLSQTGLSKKERKEEYNKIFKYQPRFEEIEYLTRNIERSYYAEIQKDSEKIKITEKIKEEEIPDELEDEKKKIAKEKEELRKEREKIAKEKEELRKEREKIAKEKEKAEQEKLYAFSSGSGFVTSSGNANIITNNHVIEGCNNIVISHKGNRINGKILAVDPKNDLAILKAKLNVSKVYPVALVDAKLLEDVIIAGYPLGKEVSAAIKITKGSVSSLAGYGDNYSNFQTDAALNQGNSGGPIINNKGNVVGVAVANYGKEEGIESFNFGIKSSTLRAFANSNGISFKYPNPRPLQNTELGELITEATVFLECHMTMSKIKKTISEIEKNRKAVYGEFLK